MKWTKEEKKVILDSFWASGIAYCPRDDASLEIKKDEAHIGRKTDLLYIRCPRCGETFNSNEIESDPEKIDQYNTEEKTEIVNSFFSNKLAYCPRDAVTLKVEHKEHTGDWTLFVRCPRCGREFQWTKEDDERIREK